MCLLQGILALTCKGGRAKRCVLHRWIQRLELIRLRDVVEGDTGQVGSVADELREEPRRQRRERARGRADVETGVANAACVGAERDVGVDPDRGGGLADRVVGVR